MSVKSLFALLQPSKSVSRTSNSEAKSEGQTNQETLDLKDSSGVWCTQKSKRITTISQVFQVLRRVLGARILPAEAHEAISRLDDVQRRRHRAWNDRRPLLILAEGPRWSSCPEHTGIASWEKVPRSRPHVGASAGSRLALSSRHPRSRLRGLQRHRKPWPRCNRTLNMPTASGEDFWRVHRARGCLVLRRCTRRGVGGLNVVRLALLSRLQATWSVKRQPGSISPCVRIFLVWYNRNRQIVYILTKRLCKLLKLNI